MITRKRAALDGFQLDEAHEAVVIQGIETGDGKENISAVSSAAGDGQRVTSARRDTVDVTIRVGLDIKKTDLQARAEALEAVNAWAARAARGAWLTVEHRPGRRLRVRLAQAPGEGDLWAWTNEFKITLRAYENPFWEDEAETTAEIGSGGVAAGSFLVEGSGPAEPGVEMLNISGAEIKRIESIQIGTRKMGFTGLGMQAGEALVIDTGETGLLRIRIRSVYGEFRSALAARTPESDDRFTVLPGSVAASFRCERACRMTVGWRCRYL